MIKVQYFYLYFLFCTFSYFFPFYTQSLENIMDIFCVWTPQYTFIRKITKHPINTAILDVLLLTVSALQINVNTSTI